MTQKEAAALAEKGIAVDFTCDTVGSAEVFVDGKSVMIVSGRIGKAGVDAIVNMTTGYLFESK